MAEFAVIGGGIVGAAIAFGLLRRGRRVSLIDAGDPDIRAATANFGLVWVNGKGRGFPAYQHWTRRSATLWPAFCEELEEVTGMGLEYHCDGGLKFCLGDDEMRQQSDHLRQLRIEAPELPDDSEIVTRHELQSLLPGARLGQDVTGGVYCSADGHANPLRLWRALRDGIGRLGGEVLTGFPVTALERRDGEFSIRSGAREHRAGRIVLTAGLGNRELAAHLGMDFPIRAERGQILVTERLAPWLRLPGNGVRQTDDGTIMIGSTKESVGLDRSATADQARRMAARAVRILPDLDQVRLVRQWGGLRVLSPDGFPLYARAPGTPDCSVIACHSGVTLAAAHARDLAAALDGERVDIGTGTEVFESFSERRFDVSQNLQ